MRTGLLHGLALLSLMAACSQSLAGVPSLIAGLHVGDELRYRYTLTTDETTALTGKTGPESLPQRTVSTQSMIVVFRVTAETSALDIVEASFESVSVGMETGNVRVAFDASAGTPPQEVDAPGARDLYGWFHPLAGAKLTLNVSPGSGEITTVQGGEELLKGAGAAHLRRYLDPDLLRSNFGVIFQLKSNTQMPPPGDKWYIKMHEYARGAKAPVWETRWVELVEGGIANVKGIVKASAKSEDSVKSSVFFRNVDATTDYSWDTGRGRLTKSLRSENIGTRYEVSGTGVRQDSELTCKAVLEMVEKATTPPPPLPTKPTTPNAPEAAKPNGTQAPTEPKKSP